MLWLKPKIQVSLYLFDKRHVHTCQGICCARHWVSADDRPYVNSANNRLRTDGSWNIIALCSRRQPCTKSHQLKYNSHVEPSFVLHPSILWIRCDETLEVVRNTADNCIRRVHLWHVQVEIFFFLHMSMSVSNSKTTDWTPIFADANGLGVHSRLDCCWDWVHKTKTRYYYKADCFWSVLDKYHTRLWQLFQRVQRSIGYSTLDSHLPVLNNVKLAQCHVKKLTWDVEKRKNGDQLPLAVVVSVSCIESCALMDDLPFLFFKVQQVRCGNKQLSLACITPLMVSFI